MLRLAVVPSERRVGRRPERHQLHGEAPVDQHHSASGSWLDVLVPPRTHAVTNPACRHDNIGLCDASVREANPVELWAPRRRPGANRLRHRRAPGRADEPLQLILVEGHAHLVRVSGIAPELEAPRAARTPAGAPRDPAGRGRSSPDAGHARRPGRLAVELGRAPAIRHGCRQRLRGHAKGRGQSSSRWL